MSKTVTLVSLPGISIALALLAAQSSGAASLTWTGEGADNFWSTPANWGGTAPAAGDSLFFGGNVRNTPVNDFPIGTVFGGITINNPSAAFSIAGNGITLGGDIADNMIVVPQTFNVALTLNGTRTIGVVESGSLILSGVISGPHGLAKINEGQLTLSGANTFSGSIVINEGTLTVGSDSNLGAAPGAPTPERIAIDGTLRTTATFTLNANRGIALGSFASAGDGTVFVNSGAVLTYGGVMANYDPGIGGLSKSGFGGLTLFGANTYGGPTAIKNGTLTLDFTQASSPANNIINSTSSLSLGGENAGTSGPGGGTVSFANLTVNGKVGASSAQTFTSTTIDLGPAVIRAANGSGGSVNLNLGSLNQNPGGAVAFITPAITGGSGAINTTTLNDNGILGGWATIGGGTPVINNIVVSTNWASAGTGGSIVPYSGFNVAATAVNLFGNVPSGANVLISNDSTGDITNNVDQAGTLTEVNSILFSRPVGFTINIGSNNTIRLGKSGGIFKSDATASATYVFGSGGTGTGNGVQDQGTLTAGGAPDTPGEIVFTINSSSQTAGSLNTELKITDNGTGPVRVIKTGPGPMKFRGHNTFSGGMYIIQGRIQMAGSELSGTGGTPNPDGFGSGPVYVLPGGQAFPSGAGFITNDWYIAGNGVSDQVGAIRLSGIFSNNITLIGDSRIGGGGFATGVPMYGKITGPFNLDFGATGNSGGGANGARLFNQSNDWTGDTTIVGRTGGTAGNTRLALGASDVIPDGFGKGNIILGNSGNNNSQCVFDLNGFNETINGLISAGNAALDFVQNGAASTTSILTLGNNDQSGTFAGIIQSGPGVLAITKIGRGKQVLTGINTYSGITTVSNGTLAISGAGSIAASTRIVVDGGTLDVSEVSAGFTHGFPVDVINGSLTIRSTVSPGIASLNLTDARVRVTSLGATPITVETSALLTGGATNLIDVVSVGNVTGYPAQFTIIKYAGFIDGLGFNFGLGSVPTPSTVGYISNNVDNTSIDLVLLDGPKPLTWTGAMGNDWNINTSINWLAFAGTPSVTPSVYLDVDLVRFDDSSLVNTVNLTTALQPSATVVSNNAVNYTFAGPGKISGATGLTKEGTGTLILDNTGTNDFLGPLAINAGTVQLGNGTAGGSFGAGAVVNNGALAFARSDNAVFNTAISGSGTLRQDGPGILTLSGNSTFTGPTVVAQSTLKAGSGTAFGTADNGTTVNSGASLDVNGQNLSAEPVVVSGSGVGGNGAIVNTGAEQLNALRIVTLAGDVALGGSTRWDIRGTGAELRSGANPFKITKVGPNQVSLVGVTVDTALGEVEIQQGNFSVQTTTTQLGDASAALLVHGGATLGLFALNAVPLQKAITLRDQARVWSENGSNIINGQVVVEGTAIFDVANAGTTPTLIVNAEIGGSGGLVKIGSGRMVMNGPFNSYAGTTVVSNGTLLVDGIYSEFGTFHIQGGTLGGVGTITGPLVVHAGGTLAPGNVANPIGALTLGGAVTLSGTSSMDVTRSGGGIANDVLTTLDALTLGGTLSLNLTGEALADGDAIVLFGFNSATGAFSSIVPATPGPGLTWGTSDLATSGTLRVLAAAQLEFGSVSQSGTNLVMMGRNGTPGGTFRILTSTDLETPTPNWVPVATNMFDANGNFNVTQGIDPGTPKRFFLFQAQQ